jgi:hypothetical protein
MNVELLCKKVNFLLLLQHQTDEKTTKVMNRLRAQAAIKTVVKQNNLMPHTVLPWTNQEVPWMGVAMDESMLEHHCCEDVNEVLAHQSRIYPLLDHFFFPGDFNAFYKLHDDESVRAQVCVVFRDVDSIIMFEEFLGFKGVLNLNPEIQFLNEGRSPLFVQFDKVELVVIFPFDQIVTNFGQFLQHYEIPFRLNLQKRVLEFDCYFLVAVQQPSPMHLGQGS